MIWAYRRFFLQYYICVIFIDNMFMNLQGAKSVVTSFLGFDPTDTKMAIKWFSRSKEKKNLNIYKKNI